MLKPICDKCSVEHNGTYGSGRFCSEACSRKRTLSNEVKTKIAESVKNHCKTKPKKEHHYTCEKCGVMFTTTTKLRYKERCDQCRQKPRHKIGNKTVTNILSLPNRTIGKIIKRSGIGCCLCSWNEARCDIHHIIPIKKGGTDDHDNLIVICPNCHRKVHENPRAYPVETLKEKAISIRFKDWHLFTSAFGTASGGAVVESITVGYPTPGEPRTLVCMKSRSLKNAK